MRCKGPIGLLGFKGFRLERESNAVDVHQASERIEVVIGTDD